MQGIPETGSPGYIFNAIFEWYAVWQMAIALAWMDEGFKDRLCRDPRGTLARELKFDFPWDVVLKIQDATGHNDPTGNPAGWEVDHWHLPSTEVLLWLPPKPPDGQSTVALANYQYTAQTYPFTCCC